MKLLFDHEILSLWSYEKRSWKNVVSSCMFYLVIAPRYFLEHITVLKSDYQFYKWSSVTFQKNGNLGARKEKLVHEACHVSYIKNAAHKKWIVVYGYTEV